MGKLLVFSFDLEENRGFLEYFLEKNEKVYFLNENFQLYGFELKTNFPLIVKYEPDKVWGDSKIFKLDGGALFSCPFKNKLDHAFSNFVIRRGYGEFRFISNRFFFDIDCILDSYRQDTLLVAEITFEGNTWLSIRILEYVFKDKDVSFKVIKQDEFFVISQIYQDDFKKYLDQKEILRNSFLGAPVNLSEGLSTRQKTFTNLPSFKIFSNFRKQIISESVGPNSMHKSKLKVFESADLSKPIRTSFLDREYVFEDEAMDEEYLEVFEEYEAMRERKSKREVHFGRAVDSQEIVENENYIDQVQEALSLQPLIKVEGKISQDYEFHFPEIPETSERFEYLQEVENRSVQREEPEVIFEHVNLNIAYKPDEKLVQKVKPAFDEDCCIFDPTLNYYLRSPEDALDISEELESISKIIDEAIAFYFKKENTDAPYFSWERAKQQDGG